MHDERREERTDLVVKKSALEVMETSFLLCFAHPARIHNPKMCFFFFFLSPHGFLIQSKEVLCFQIPSLLLSFAPFLQTDTRRPKYPACAPPQFTSQETLSDKSVWRMFVRGGVSKLLNKTSVMEPFSLRQRKHLAVLLQNLNARKFHSRQLRKH